MRRAIDKAAGNLWLSPISVWEAHLLIERKRLRVKESAHSWIRKALDAAPLEVAPLTVDVAIESRRIMVTHDDAADRFIAATASTYDLVLLTEDERLLDGKGFKVFRG
jgi:PIN domain nuclease of toxin-antitoxin system